MAGVSENWYIVLELEFDPPVEDETVIAQQIDVKKKYWSSKSQDFMIGTKCRQYLDSIQTIKRDMIGPENIRKKLAAEACAIAYEAIDKYLRIVSKKGYVTPAEIENIAQKSQKSVEAVKKRVAGMGVKIKTDGGDSSATKNMEVLHDKYYKTKPQNAAVYDNFAERLAVFKATTLYGFLFPEMSEKDARSTPCADLRAQAAKLKKSKYFKNDAVSSAGQKLCGDCDTVFKDEASKELYDIYVDYAKRKAILDEVKSIASISGEISEEQFEDYVKQLTMVMLDHKLAHDLMTAFCTVEKIVFRSGSKPQKKENTNFKQCRCGFLNDVSDGRKICGSCGLPLMIECPSCHTLSENTVKICKCKFDFANLDKALSLCKLADMAIEALDFQSAKAHLADATRYWAGCPNAVPVKKKLEDYERRAGQEVGKMRDAIASKRYYEARNRYNQIRRLFPGYTDIAVEEEVFHAVEEAEKLLAQAKATKDEKTVIELCTRAFRSCADLPGVRELMPVPRVVQGLSMKANPLTRCNILSWMVTGDTTVRYTVVRSANGWVRNVEDGEIVYQGSGSTYVDKAIEPAVTYYYNVFAERAEMYSQGASGNIQPLTNLFEINNVMVTAADHTLNLVWGVLPAGATAEIYEITANGNEKLVASTTASSYLATALQNGQTYRFRILLSYNVNGKTEYTDGVTVSGIPDLPPLPVDTLRVKPSRDGVYEAVWTQDAQADVRLFCSLNKPSHAMGDMMSLSALEAEMSPVQTLPLSAKTRQELASDEKGFSFEYTGVATMYVVAAVVKSSTAVFGNVARVGKGETVGVTDARIINGKLHIFVQPPAKATGFVVLYRSDRFAADISDAQSIRKYIPLKQYQLNNALVLDTAASQKFYISVFAEFCDGEDKDYSAGSDYLFNNAAKENITYSIKVNKKLFGGGTVDLEFEAENREFELPAIEVMSAVGNVPVFKKSAKLFYEIPAQHVRGSLCVKIPMPKNLPHDTHIKAFFADEAAQAGSILRLKQKSNYKIS